MRGQGDNTFSFRCANGLYLVTLIIGDADAATSDFDVLAEGEIKLQQKKLNKEEFKSQLFAVRVKDGRLDLTFHALKEYWLVNGVILQPLIYATEDYTFLKPWWRWEWTGGGLAAKHGYEVGE